MATVFFTGFPGFLGVELLPRVLERRAEDRAVCLVQARYMPQARAALDRLAAERPALAGRVALIEGDIARADLGLVDSDLRSDVAEIFHLAAVYDLSVGRALAMRVNVEGTRHMLAFAAGCERLERFQYVSTCFVSGRYAGVFGEGDLEKGQRFNNFYEETKFLAEVEVQRAMGEGLPATIYRPSIVVGDSRTGATQKYDGPYFFIRYLLRQPPVALMPVVGDPTMTRLNVVPRDFVVAAIAHLSGLAASAGRVYQLADPEPLTVDEMLTAVAEATGRQLVRVPMTRDMAKLALTHVPGMAAWMGIPASTVDYFAHPTYYTVDQARRDLAGTGIAVPRFETYLDKLVAFTKAHPEIGSAAMV